MAKSNPRFPILLVALPELGTTETTVTDTSLTAMPSLRTRNIRVTSSPDSMIVKLLGSMVMSTTVERELKTQS